VALSAYLLLSLNNEIVLIDLLFTEIQLSLGTALLSFFIIGFFVTLVLELINSLRRNKIKE
jgi:ABC-type tungstate transport system substrate-binding protein